MPGHKAWPAVIGWISASLVLQLSVLVQVYKCTYPEPEGMNLRDNVEIKSLGPGSQLNLEIKNYFQLLALGTTILK